MNLTKNHFLAALCLVQLSLVHAQPVMETGGQIMPNEWIDKDTHHKVIKLTRIEGNNLSFYFHNNPFYKNKMVFYNTNNGQKQIYTVDLKTIKQSS